MTCSRPKGSRTSSMNCAKWLNAIAGTSWRNSPTAAFRQRPAPSSSC